MSIEPARKCYKFHYPSFIGDITVYGDDKENIVGLRMVSQKHFDNEYAFKTAKTERLKVFDLAEKWLDRYFKGKKPKTDEIPINPSGSEFQREVWRILCKIPYGHYTTYGAVAREVARRRDIPAMSAQAIGGAVARNPILIIIPCHRVIAGNGKLTGYAGGLPVKNKLLKHENVNQSKLYRF